MTVVARINTADCHRCAAGWLGVVGEVAVGVSVSLFVSTSLSLSVSVSLRLCVCLCASLCLSVSLSLSLSVSHSLIVCPKGHWIYMSVVVVVGWVGRVCRDIAVTFGLDRLVLLLHFCKINIWQYIFSCL